MPRVGDGRERAWQMLQDSRHYNKIGNAALKQTYMGVALIVAIIPLVNAAQIFATEGTEGTEFSCTLGGVIKSAKLATPRKL